MNLRERKRKSRRGFICMPLQIHDQMTLRLYMVLFNDLYRPTDIVTIYAGVIMQRWILFMITFETQLTEKENMRKKKQQQHHTWTNFITNACILLQIDGSMCIVIVRCVYNPRKNHYTHTQTDCFSYCSSCVTFQRRNSCKGNETEK